MNAKMLSMKYALPFVVMLILVTLMRHLTSFINAKYVLGLGDKLTFKMYMDGLKKNKQMILTPGDILVSMLYISVLCCTCKGHILNSGISVFILSYIISSADMYNSAEKPYSELLISAKGQGVLLLNALGASLAAVSTCAIFKKYMN